jgi:hypothetical protein
MNLNAEDIVGNLSQLTSKLEEGISISDITNLIQLPQLDQFSEIASSLLPQKLIKSDGEGNISLLNPLELQQKIKQGVDSLKNVIEQEIRDVITEVTSTIQQASDVVNQGVNTVKSLGSKLTSNQLEFFDEAFETISSITNMGVDMGFLADYGNVVSSATNTIRQFSPKQIRDLANPENLQATVTETLNAANGLLGDEVLNTVTQYVQGAPSIQSIGSLFTTSNTLLSRSGPNSSNQPYNIQANVTTYHGKGDGGDIDAYNKKSTTKKQLVSGKSCAVDNVTILFGSKVEVPGIGTFNAVDRSRGGDGVYLYYEDVTKANEIQAKLKNPVLIKVTPPKSSQAVVLNKQENRGTNPKLI